MKKVMNLWGLVLLALLSTTSAANADVSWSWSYAPSTITVSELGDPALIPVAIQVTNDATSTASLILGSLVLSGGVVPGVLTSPNGQVTLVPQIYGAPVATLAPGESILYVAAKYQISTTTIPMQDAFWTARSFTTNLNYQVNVDTPTGLVAYQEMAPQPLHIQFDIAAVPEPSSMMMSSLGLAALLFMRRQRAKELNS